VSIPISQVVLGAAEEALVLEVLRSGRLAQGPMVERLEREFQSWCDCDHVVAVANGTVSLVAALQALNLPAGTEVITSPFTFVATLNAILEAGLVARFADIGDDFCMDPTHVEAQVTERTSAVMPVHLYGQPADMPTITQVAERNGLAVVEDAAQAHGARVDGRAVGSFGVGSFSLYATKNLMSGEGGLVTTNDSATADRLRLLRNQGMRARYQYELAGHNYRMTELQAAVAIPQLSRLGERTERRRINARRLTEGLSGVPGLRTPTIAEGREHVWHQYTVLVTDASARTRDEVAAHLDRRGIGNGMYYPRPVYDYDCYRDHPGVVVEPMPNAELAARECLSLPVHPFLTDDQVDQVIEAVREALDA
jgi:dTDP-4-amino-4,6-dideoxygalactose transaminase